MRSGWRRGQRACRCQRPPSGTFRQPPAWPCSPPVTAPGSREPRCRPHIDVTPRRLTAQAARRHPGQLPPAPGGAIWRRAGQRPLSRHHRHCRTAAPRGPGIRAPGPLVTGRDLLFLAEGRPGLSDHRPRQRAGPADTRRPSRAARLGPAICAQLHSAADASARPGRSGALSLTSGTSSAPASTAAPASPRWPPNSGTSSCGSGGSPTATSTGRQPAPMPARSATRQTWPPLRATSPPWWPRSTPPLTRLTASPLDRDAVRAAAADHRLYVPAFTRTNAAVVRRRYRAACPSRVDEILASYDDAIEASIRATSKLDDLALVLDAPTWPLAALHAQPQRVLRAYRPGGTSSP